MKVAKLVTVILVSRVIVDEHATKEDCYAAAKDDLIVQAHCHYIDALHNVQEDEDDPYDAKNDGE